MFTALLVDELWRNGIEADFAIVCVDPRNHTNTGYAYVNVCDGNNARKLLTWHGRDMLAGRLCTQGGARRQLSVAYAAKQGFDMCVTLNGRKQLHDPRLRAWVLPARATRRREIEASMHEARTRAFATTPARTVVAAELLVRLQPAGPVAAVPVASGDQCAPNLSVTLSPHTHKRLCPLFFFIIQHLLLLALVWALPCLRPDLCLQLHIEKQKYDQYISSSHKIKDTFIINTTVSIT
jgi:hypothetical protein